MNNKMTLCVNSEGRHVLALPYRHFMSLVIILLSSSLLKFSVFAQGIVNLSNFDAGAGIDAPITFLNGSPVSEGYTAQIYASAFGGGSLEPVLPVTTFRPLSPGYLWAVQVTIPGVPGGETAELQIRVFNGPDWQQSTCRGASIPIAVGLTGGTQVPAPMVGLEPFQVDCVPEPSLLGVFAIGVIGLGSYNWPRKKMS
jgi:hypothetical protein